MLTIVIYHDMIGKGVNLNLRVGKSNGRPYLSIVHGYRDKETRKVKSKVIKSLGYLDELQKQYPDPITHFKAVVAKMNKQEADGKSPVPIRIDRGERLSHRQDNRKNIGYAALSKLYHSLGLHTFFNNRSRQWNVEYSTNSIMRMLIFSRILNPASKKKTFEQRGVYFEKMDFSLLDIYRCLSNVITLKRELLIHLNNQIRKLFGRSNEIVYYDVTNYYFEIDKQDDMRKKGVSKEHRPDPIIQMGLLTDSFGIPITYDTFPGNTNDCETYIPVLRRVRKDFDLGRIIVVADKGINTGDNIAYCLLSGNGYVFSQSVRGGNKELKDYVLDEKGYRGMDSGFKIKSRQYPRLVYVTDENGEKKKMRLDEKQVVFFSLEYYKRAKAERAACVAKAQDLITNPSKYKRATSFGAAKYVKNLVFDKQTGEILTSKQKPIFDEEKLLEEEKYDGYYAIVTSEWKESDEKILDIYRGLWQIEEAFKVCKNDLETRPVYVSRPERIEAHFLLCFVALVIARLLAHSLGNEFSVGKIAESLSMASGSHIEQNWYLFDYADDVTQSVLNKMGIDLERKYMCLGEIKKLIGETKKGAKANASYATDS
jgi:transposase